MAEGCRSGGGGGGGGEVLTFVNTNWEFEVSLSARRSGSGTLRNTSRILSSYALRVSQNTYNFTSLGYCRGSVFLILTSAVQFAHAHPRVLSNQKVECNVNSEFSCFVLRTFFLLILLFFFLK